MNKYVGIFRAKNCFEIYMNMMYDMMYDMICDMDTCLYVFRDDGVSK